MIPWNMWLAEFAEAWRPESDTDGRQGACSSLAISWVALNLLFAGVQKGLAWASPRERSHGRAGVFGPAWAGSFDQPETKLSGGARRVP